MKTVENLQYKLWVLQQMHFKQDKRDGRGGDRLKLKTYLKMWAKLHYII